MAARTKQTTDSSLPMDPGEATLLAMRRYEER